MKILLSTDFSESARIAADYACYLAEHLKASIILFHAEPKHSKLLEQVDREIIQAAKESIHELCDELRVQTGNKIPISTAVIHNYPPEVVINEYVEQEKIDLIILGTKGATAAKKILMGSFTAAVIRHATVPVIAVPEQVNIKPIEHIAYPSSLKNIHEEIKIAAHFAQRFNAAVDVLFVVNDEDERNTDTSDILNKMQHSANYEHLSFTRIEEDNMATAIDNFVRSKNSDLLVMFFKKKNFLERLFNPNLTETMSYHTNVPLLAFKLLN
jgi:nucleotide-binding universal stress UspA family protein